MTTTIKCKILAIRVSQYTQVVVEDVNRDYTDDLKYVMLVLLPNGYIPVKLEVGDIGYVEFETVKAGKSKGFNVDNQDFEYYKYNANYFINFIKEKDVDNTVKEYKF